MKYAFIAGHRESHSVEKMAEMLQVSRSGYYAWRSRGLCPRDERNQELARVISQIQKEFRYRYGAKRMTKKLNRRGYAVGHMRVARLMKIGGMQARRKKRFRSTTNSNHTHPVAANVLARRFVVAQPNRAWVSDITYSAIAEGWMYLCVRFWTLPVARSLAGPSAIA